MVSRPRSDKRRHQHRRAQRIHQAEAHALDKFLRVLLRPDRMSVRVPLGVAQFLQFLLSHSHLLRFCYLRCLLTLPLPLDPAVAS